MPSPARPSKAQEEAAEETEGATAMDVESDGKEGVGSRAKKGAAEGSGKEAAAVNGGGERGSSGCKERAAGGGGGGATAGAGAGAEAAPAPSRGGGGGGGRVCGGPNADGLLLVGGKVREALLTRIERTGSDG